MNKVNVRIEAVVNPTEDKEKVATSIKNVFGDVNLEAVPFQQGFILRGIGIGLEFLSPLKKGLERERIRDAAKAYLLRRIEGHRIVFHLDKQASYARRITFYIKGGSPLGPITVIIESRDPLKVVEWLTKK